LNPVEAFEAEFRDFVGSKHAVAVSSGSAALHNALLSLDLKPGRIVVTTPFTFISTVNAILQCGAHPVFADIDPETYCIDPEDVARKIEGLGDFRLHVQGVLAVHLFGNTCDVDGLLKICRREDLFLVEDCSQALGAQIRGKQVGTWGDAGTFSFYATKNLWTFEGGMLVTDDDEVAKRARQIRNHGLDDSGRMVRMGYNYKLNWLSAFLGETMLRLHKPAILAELGRYGIKDGYYPHVVYDHPYYRKLGITGACPVAEATAEKVRKLSPQST